MVDAAGEPRCGGGVEPAEEEEEEAHAVVPPSRPVGATHTLLAFVGGRPSGSGTGARTGREGRRPSFDPTPEDGCGQCGISPLLASMELPGVALCCGAATATGGEEMLRMGSSDAARRRRKTSGVGARRRRTDSGAAAERRLTSLTARCSYQWPCLVPLEREEEDKGCSVGRMNSARLVE
jgi:hypothetical protein